MRRSNEISERIRSTREYIADQGDTLRTTGYDVVEKEGGELEVTKSSNVAEVTKGRQRIVGPKTWQGEPISTITSKAQELEEAREEKGRYIEGREKATQQALGRVEAHADQVTAMKAEMGALPAEATTSVGKRGFVETLFGGKPAQNEELRAAVQDKMTEDIAGELEGVTTAYDETLKQLQVLKDKLQRGLVEDREKTQAEIAHLEQTLSTLEQRKQELEESLDARLEKRQQAKEELKVVEKIATSREFVQLMGEANEIVDKILTREWEKVLEKDVPRLQQLEAGMRHVEGLIKSLTTAGEVLEEKASRGGIKGFLSKTVAKIVEVPAGLLVEAKAKLESSIARATSEKKAYEGVVNVLGLVNSGKAKIKDLEEAFWESVRLDKSGYWELGMAGYTMEDKGDVAPDEKVRVRLLRYAVRRRFQEYLREQKQVESE